MKRYFLAVSLLLCGAYAGADTPTAVVATNYQAGLTSGDTNVSHNRSTNFYDINGNATFPLATYFGATLSGNYDNTKIASNPFPDTTPASAWPRCSIQSDNIDTGLFARNSSFGKIGVGYGAGQQKSHCSATFVDTNTDTLNTRHSSASAEYYFSRVTVGVARSKVHLESGSVLDSDTLTMSWYPINDASIALAADGLDFKNIYHLNMEYQPEFLDNSTSLLFSYTTTNQTLTSHSISIGFRYFFGTNADLLTRDRHYR